jgi:hypothetical protein
MIARLKAALVMGVLVGCFVVGAQNVASAAIPVELSPQDKQEFVNLIQPEGWSEATLVAWLTQLGETHPEPGVIGELSLDLSELVNDDNPNRDTILRLIQDMLATAAGPQLFRPTTSFLDTSENPCKDNPSPVCG